MTVLIDTNVALNKLLCHPTFYSGSNVIFKLAEAGKINGYISASAITDIFYISQKALGKKVALEAIRHLLNIYYPATVTDKDIYKALELDWEDFEDSVQYIVGESISADYIVTRNTEDFTSSTIPVVTPEQFIQIITE